MNSKTIHMVAFILLAVGGLNWLLIGLLNMNLVMVIFGGIAGGLIEKLIYILVGVSAVYELVTHKKNCTTCSTGPAKPM